MQAPVHKMHREEALGKEKTDPKASIKHYEEIIKKNDLDKEAYDRLMILYRKEKEYKKEAALIRKAIKAYEAFYAKHQPLHSKKVAALSRSIAISSGLMDKKGKTVYDPQPISGWKKRLAVVTKKLK